MTMFRPAYVPGIAFEHAGKTPCQIANVLDGIGVTPTGAYSTRRLLSTYMGPALQVKRQSDQHTLDIGFDSNCDLESTTLLAFCAGTNCNINIWYDQSGHGNNVSAFAGDASQTPYVVVGGAIAATLGGHVASQALAGGSGGNFLNTNTSGMVGTNQGSVFAVANVTSGGLTNSTASWWRIPALLGFSSASSNGTVVNFSFGQTGTLYSPPSFIPMRYTGTWLGSHTDMPAPVPYTYGTSQIFALRYNTADPSPTKAYIDGGTPAINGDPTANDVAENFAIGIGGTVEAFAVVGTIAEVIVFQTELSLSDSNILGANQALYWGLTWGTITV